MSDSETQTNPLSERPSRGSVILTPGVLIALAVTGLAAFGIAVLVTFRSASSAPAMPENGDYRGTLVDPPHAVSDFTMTDQNGNPASLSDFHGRFVLLYFGYTNCPDVCPLTLNEFKQIRERLGDQSAQVSFVFVTVDPERDTPQRMKEYLAQRDVGDFVTGMTGDEATLQRISGDYGLYMEQMTPHDDQAEPVIDHTSASFLLDRDRRLRVIFSIDLERMTLDPDMVAGRIREFLPR